MPYLSWNHELASGLSNVDEQHKELVTILQLLSQAIADKEKTGVIVTLFHRLADHCHDHFRSEENLMEQYDYPKLAAHRAHHESLLGELARLQKQAEEGTLPLGEDTIRSLRDWFTAHILRDDKEFVPFIQQKRGRL